MKNNKEVIKRTPFLDIYFRNMKTGKCIHANGLCDEVANLNRDLQEIFYHIKPTPEDIVVLNDNNMCTTYWGEDKDLFHSSQGIDFTKLRQTLILLCACINEEY